MNLILETDLGGDPDDFFTICYLISAGVNIRLINLAPGSKRQVAIAKFILNHLGLDVPVGSFDPSGTKPDKVQNDMHTKVMKKYNAPLEMQADGYGHELMTDVLKQYPDVKFLFIGPLKNLNEYLTLQPLKGNRVVMQGGYVSYDLHDVLCERLQKFEGQMYVPTFNLGGCNDGGKRLIAADAERYFVGKNLCHTVLYDKTIHAMVAEDVKTDAMKLFVTAMNTYLSKHSNKKFHDPLAAVALLHPEIFTWFNGRLEYENGKWGTLPDENADKMAIDVDREKFWNYIKEGN